MAASSWKSLCSCFGQNFSVTVMLTSAPYKDCTKGENEPGVNLTRKEVVSVKTPLLDETDSQIKLSLLIWSLRMDLLSPTSAFRFPMPGGDGQSLQRHRSTSTPNVHMVSTVSAAGASIIEVSADCFVHVWLPIVVYLLNVLKTERAHSFNSCH